MIPVLAACASGTPPPPPAPAPPPAGPATVPVEPGPDLVGLCDASAAVTIGGRFLVVADDERNVLRVFDAATFAPAGTVDLGALSPMLAGKKEADLEGMAATGDGTVWVIGSHDSGSDTERRPSRQRLFALRLAASATGVEATLAHGPTDAFLEKGQQTNELYGIVVNTVGRTSKDPLGLSIEGLATGPAGSLLVGFRAPIHGEKALIERLDDPVGLAAGGEPKLTGPRWLPLDGRGVRSLEQDGAGWLVLAGPPVDGDDFALFRWTGFDDGTKPVRLPVAFGALHPEALVRIGESWWVLSDDGRRKVEGTDCKDLPEDRRRARTARVVLPP